MATRKTKAPVNSGAGAHDSKLADFFHDELKDIYWAEKNIVKALLKMKKAANTEELKAAFEDHLQATKGHVSRLEKIFTLLEYKLQAKKCEAMEGILKEGESIIEDTEEGTSIRDVGLIFAAQKVEHYEISTYGGLATLASSLGYTEVEALLRETLNEEKETDQLLTKIAEDNVNYAAAEEVE